MAVQHIVTIGSDLQRYIQQRKLRDPVFAKDFESGYESFKAEVLQEMNLMTQKIVINPNGDSLYLNNDEMSRYIELSQRPIQTHDDGLGEGSEYTYRHYTLNDEPFGDYNIERTDPALIQLVEESLGNDGELEKLRVVEIPDDVEWEILSIGNMDGCSESIHEKHRVWE